MADHPRIRLGHLKIVDHLILGLVSNRVEKEDLKFSRFDLDTLAMNSWNQICDALNKDEINGAFITIPAALDLFASGLDIRLLMFTHRSGSILVRNSAAKIKHLADLKGKTMLVPYDLSVQHMLFHRFLASAGLTFGGVDNGNSDIFKEIANPFLMPEMIEKDPEGEIGGYFVAEPFGSQAVDTGLASPVCTSDSLWKDHPCCAFVLNRSTIDNFPDAIEELVKEFFNTGQMIQSHKDDQIVSAAQTFFEQNEKVTRHVLFETGLSFDPAKLMPDISAINIIQDYLVDEMGIMENKINLDDFILHDYALKATSELNIEN
ncbi:MAG: ABC transporter substrate-binding protein [Desulfobacteraceae bacterium]|nr:ABC transporter substrate-binding protein [Desulfobacteraceae bacterium]